MFFIFISTYLYDMYFILNVDNTIQNENFEFKKNIFFLIFTLRRSKFVSRTEQLLILQRIIYL